VLHCADPSRGCGVPFIRAIGRWTMTALVINSIIGSGIFGLPSEVTRLVGRASPLAMIFAGLAMGIILACLAEVASQFSEPGGVYLYVRTAFGRFAGMQTGWFHLLAASAGGAANASLFTIYLAGLLPWAGGGRQHALLLALLISVPTVANYIGVRSGAAFSNVLTITKLLPLALIIALGIVRFGHHIEILKRSEISSPGIASWLSVLFLLFFPYGGSENALVPAGEVKNPRHTVPFGLLAGLVVCAAVFTLIQFVTVATIGTSTTPRPLAETASVLVGQSGGMLVTIGVMISTYGWLSGGLLEVPRLACSLAAQGDAPRFLGKLHPRFKTPALAIVLYATFIWFLAATGAYLWIAALGSGAKTVIYSAGCASLIRLRRQNPRADALRLPFGLVFALLGILICLTVLTRVQARQALLMGITAMIAAANWWWAKRRERRTAQAVVAAGASR
jgi:basic amino acid/polyamine antiporter, APA family